LKKRFKALVAILLIALLIFLLVISGFFPYPNPPKFSPSCSKFEFNLTEVEQGVTYFCGLGSVSDGKLSFAVHSYNITYWQDLPFTSYFPASDSFAMNGTLFLMVNLTVSNVGSGNASILGSSFNVQVTDVNGDSFGVDQYPMSIAVSIPGYTMLGGNTSLYLPPGSSADRWLLFNFLEYNPASCRSPCGSQEPSIPSMGKLQLDNISYYEDRYGGNYQSNGSLLCPCQSHQTEFIISVNSTLNLAKNSP